MAATKLKDLEKAGAVAQLALATAKQGNYVVRDRGMPALGVRVSLQTKSWTYWGGKKGNPVKIGPWPDLSYSQAREIAQGWKKEAKPKPGYNPLTVEGAIDKTIAALRRPAEEGKRPARPKTLIHYAALKGYLGDLRNKPIEAVTKEDVIALHKEIGKKGEVQADNMLRVLSAVMNRNEIEPNPVRVLKNKRLFFNAKKSSKVIPAEKLSALYTALLRLPNDLGRDLLLTCLYSGLRSNEARSLSWDRVDLESKILTIPAEIAKNGNRLVLPLTTQLVAILRTRQALNAATYEAGDPRLGCVFPNARREGKEPYMNNAAFFYKQASASVRKALKLKKKEDFAFTTHSLRHLYVTCAAQARLPYVRIKYLVNHRPTDITEKYLHFDVEDFREDAQKVADHIDTACNVSQDSFAALFGK